MFLLLAQSDGNGYPLPSAFWMVGILLGVPYALFHLTLNSSPCGGHYPAHLGMRNLRLGKLKCMDGARIQTKLLCFHIQLLRHIASFVKVMVILTPVSI